MFSLTLIGAIIMTNSVASQNIRLEETNARSAVNRTDVTNSANAMNPMALRVAKQMGSLDAIRARFDPAEANVPAVRRTINQEGPEILLQMQNLDIEGLASKMEAARADGTLRQLGGAKGEEAADQISATLRKLNGVEKKLNQSGINETYALEKAKHAFGQRQLDENIPGLAKVFNITGNDTASNIIEKMGNEKVSDGLKKIAPMLEKMENGGNLAEIATGLVNSSQALEGLPKCPSCTSFTSHCVKCETLETAFEINKYPPTSIMMSESKQKKLADAEKIYDKMTSVCQPKMLCSIFASALQKSIQTQMPDIVQGMAKCNCKRYAGTDADDEIGRARVLNRVNGADHGVGADDSDTEGGVSGESDRVKISKAAIHSLMLLIYAPF